MNLRKVASVLVIAGLAVGLIGAGVSASYSDNATAAENVNVGTFACQISSTDPTADVSPDGRSVTITLPEIVSSAGGSAATTFTVSNSGSMPAVVHVSATSTGGLFSPLAQLPAGDVTLAAGANQTYTNVGLSWSALDNTALDTTAHATYMADCGEVPQVVHVSAIAPTSSDETCSASGTITIPDVEGVDYFLDGVAAGDGSHNVSNGPHTVTATAEDGYVLDGYPAGGWAISILPKSGCEIHVMAVAPPVTAESATASGVCVNGTISIPSVTGVDYFIDGVAASAGSHDAQALGHTVTATAQAGYVLDSYPAGGWNVNILPYGHTCYVGGSSDGTSATLPTSALPGDLAVVFAYRSTTGFPAAPIGFTSIGTANVSTTLNGRASYKVLATGDTISATTATATEVVVYRHAAYGGLQSANFHASGIRNVTCNPLTIPSDGSVTVLCLAFDLNPNTNIRLLGNVTSDQPTATGTNRSSGFGATNLGAADVIGATSWPTTSWNTNLVTGVLGGWSIELYYIP